MDTPSEATVATLEDTDIVDGQPPHTLVRVDSVFAIGDCAGYVDGPLPALAQVRSELRTVQLIAMGMQLV
jgi:NADH dehydrogenase FAD-containing subunit